MKEENKALMCILTGIILIAIAAICIINYDKAPEYNIDLAYKEGSVEAKY